MEAMASGLPIVTTPNSGSLVRDGVDGYVVPYDDVDQQCARLNDLICNPELRREMGKCARQRIGEADVSVFQRRISDALVGLG